MSIKAKIEMCLSDKMFLYYIYYKKMNTILNLKSPKTFSEKIQWIKLYGNLERFSDLVDKYSVRKFVEEKIGSEYLIKIYGIYDNFEEIDFEKLPNNFVIKDTHGSGSNFICRDKEKLDMDELREVVNQWFSKNFYTMTRERQYKNCEHRLLVEELLEDSNGRLNDYKFFCLGGKVRIIEVDIDRFGSLKRDYYDVKWNKMELKKGVDNSNFIIDKPKHLEKMIKMAEKLADGIELLRGDFYYVDNTIYFGELTFTPASGLTKFVPATEDLRLASYVDLKKY